MDKYPELEKMKEAQADSSVISEFLDWLRYDADYVLCRWPEDENYPQPASIGMEQLLADYFQIDLKKVEAERRAILEYLQEQQA